MGREREERERERGEGEGESSRPEESVLGQELAKMVEVRLISIDRVSRSALLFTSNQAEALISLPTTDGQHYWITSWSASGHQSSLLLHTSDH